MNRKILPLVLACSCALAQDTATEPAKAPGSTPAPPALRAPTLADLFSERHIVDVAISPSGRHLAAIVRREGIDRLMVMDLTTRGQQIIHDIRHDSSGSMIVATMGAVYWKSDDRLVYGLSFRPAEGVRTVNPGMYAKMGRRLYSINRDGSNPVGLLADNRNSALNGANDLGDVANYLANDPAHLLLLIDGFSGRTLFKVNILTGNGEQIERPAADVFGWWFDVAGTPVVRMESSSGNVTLYRKNNGKWVRFLRMRVREFRERSEYEVAGPSDQPGKFYVLARREGHDRAGLYLFDLEKEQFGEPLLENPQYDLTSARISRDGKRVIHYCHVAHVRICESPDPKLNAHMRGLRKMFDDSANVYVYDSSEDGKSFLLFIESPRDPPGFYYYLTESRRIEALGPTQQAMTEVMLPRASVVNYTARDGKQLSGYLTVPAKTPKDQRLPLVMYPHGGPETRDSLSFDSWAQYFVSRGYAVFQPNFRGSDGYGRAFAESGYGEWGRKMQDDISDAIKALAEQGVVDPQRVCIVGASYGGYAALAGATLTPDLYKCAVSVAGISDLQEFITWRKRGWSSESASYVYMLKAIGNPEADAQRLRETSPAQQVAKVKAPILLVHGTEDYIVPISQSRMMKRLLDQSGRKTELIELEHEGHGGWSKKNEMYAMSSIGAFLWKHLGPGYGVTSAPELIAKSD